MIRWIEKTVFLRSLNYLRISHEYAFRYNYLYPIIFGAFFSVSALYFTPVISMFQKGGLLLLFTPVLSILAPFYIAALAAVSTFTGVKAVDRPFEMREPVQMNVIGEGGDWETIDVTPRHFLSLLFGYCTSLSIFLLIVTIFAPLFAEAIVLYFTNSGNLILGLVVILYFFIFFQLILGTLLGVYFLSDRIHRHFG